MRNKFLIAILLILLLSLSLCMSGIAFADSCELGINQYVYDYANEFVKSIDGGEIKKSIPIYDSYGNVNSCCFTVYTNDQPYMYFILDNYYREGISPIIEIGFGDYSFNNDEEIINLNYIDYGVKNKNKILFNNEEIKPENYKITYKSTRNINKLSNVSIYDGYMSDLSNVGDLKKLALISDYNFFEPFIQSDLATSSQRGDGICGATTAMNVLKYFNDAKGLIYDIYDDYNLVYAYLRSYQTLDVGDNGYNIKNQSRRKEALTKYIKNHTSLKISATKYLINNWTYIYNDINNGKVVDYRYSGNEGGHCVLVVGAASYGSSSKFIYVADTWNKNPRWLNYGYHDNISCMSIKIS